MCVRVCVFLFVCVWVCVTVYVCVCFSLCVCVCQLTSQRTKTSGYATRQPECQNVIAFVLKPLDKNDKQKISTAKISPVKPTGGTESLLKTIL